MPKVRYCNDSRDSSFASCDFRAPASRPCTTWHGAAIPTIPKQCLLMSAFIQRRFHGQFDGHSTGPPENHCDQSTEWQAIAILIKAMKRFVVKIFPLLRHFSRVVQMFQSCVQAAVSAVQMHQMPGFFPKRPLCTSYSHEDPNISNSYGFDWLRQCCSGASNVCHPCLPRRGPKKCLHKKSFAHECSLRWNIYACMYRCKDCLPWKVNAVIDRQCSTPVQQSPESWYSLSSFCQAMLDPVVWSCMTLWFHDLLRSSEIFFQDLLQSIF